MEDSDSLRIKSENIGKKGRYIGRVLKRGDQHVLSDEHGGSANLYVDHIGRLEGKEVWVEARLTTQTMGLKDTVTEFKVEDVEDIDLYDRY